MRGLFNKFTVARLDHADAPGQKHERCEYFVLDLTHDSHAVPALLAYANSCESEYPMLADDLRGKAGQQQMDLLTTSTGQRLRVARDERGLWSVWFNSSPLFEEVVVAFGDTRTEVIAQAVRVFAAAVVALEKEK